MVNRSFKSPMGQGEIMRLENTDWGEKSTSNSR